GRRVHVARDGGVSGEDCGSERGLGMLPIVEGGDVGEPLRQRVLGRVVAEDIYPADSDEVLCPRGTLLDEEWVEILETNGVDRVLVRSAITCETRHGRSEERRVGTEHRSRD